MKNRLPRSCQPGASTWAFLGSYLRSCRRPQWHTDDLAAWCNWVAVETSLRESMWHHIPRWRVFCLCPDRRLMRRSICYGHLDHQFELCGSSFPDYVYRDARKIRPNKGSGKAPDQRGPGRHWPIQLWSAGDSKKKQQKINSLPAYDVDFFCANLLL